MRAKSLFVNMLLGLAVAALLFCGELPQAVGQGDLTASGKLAAGEEAGRPADKKAASKSDSTESKNDAAKKGTQKETAPKRGTQKKDTQKKGAPSKSTEKRAAKAQREQSAKSAGGSGSPAAAPRKPSEAEREEAALGLVREHHPALVELLERLKATKQADYQQAIKELYRDSQRLAAVRERDANRYTLELRSWQLDSRIRLLAARLSLEDRAELEEELKACLAERAEVRLSLKKLERDRSAARAKKLDEEIAKLTAGQEAEVNRSFERLLRAAQKAAGNRRQGVKKAAAGAAAEAAGGASQADRPQAPDAKGESSPR